MDLKNFMYDGKLMVILTGERIAKLGYEGVRVWIRHDGWHQDNGKPLPFPIYALYTATSGLFGFKTTKNFYVDRIYFT
jgi:hypothetical protein